MKIKISNYTVNAWTSWDIGKVIIMFLVTLLWCVLPAITVIACLFVHAHHGTLNGALATALTAIVLTALFAYWQFLMSVGWMMALYDSCPECYDSKGRWVYVPERTIEICI
jgi:ascorbate-specific PTS system EIIC-type component UlaA